MKDESYGIWGSTFLKPRLETSTHREHFMFTRNNKKIPRKLSQTPSLLYGLLSLKKDPNKHWILKYQSSRIESICRCPWQCNIHIQVETSKML